MKFLPGQKSPRTAVYRVEHVQHRFSHDVLVMEGDTFPRCRRCGEFVSFAPLTASEAQNPVSSIFEDLDFRKTA